MAQDRPDAKNLLLSVSAFLETLLPTLEGDARFKTRVSMHLLGIVAREIELGAVGDARERAALERILERDGDLEEQNRALAQAIRSGAFDASWERVFAHILATVEDKVRIVRPDRLGD